MGNFRHSTTDRTKTAYNPVELMKNVAKKALHQSKERNRNLIEFGLASETSGAIFLPGSCAEQLPMPNHLARSSLFAPLSRNERRRFRKKLLISRKDAIIRYTGEQLDEADADLLLHITHLVFRVGLETVVEINRTDLLNTMRRSTGGSDYKWLHARINALSRAKLTIDSIRSDGKVKYRIGHDKEFFLIKKLGYIKKTNTYRITLDKRWKTLFSNNEYSLISWEKRQQIGKGKAMAKALQRLFATSDNTTQYYRLAWLKEKLVYTGREYDFINALKNSADELIRVGIIAAYEIAPSTKGIPQLKIELK